MSDFASQHLDEHRIPSSLIQTYIQYKKDTTAVVSWLVSHGTSKYKRLPVLSLQDLFSLADIAKAKAVEMPRTIDFQFQAAISARAHLSKWYKRVHDHYGNVDQDTCNHEHFTAWSGSTIPCLCILLTAIAVSEQYIRTCVNAVQSQKMNAKGGCSESLRMIRGLQRIDLSLSNLATTELPPVLVSQGML